jgi:hypothetical protein
MPSKQTTRRAKADLRAGKRPSTAAGEFVREEIEHVRHGKHGARSPQQAIAIGLSKARRAGVPLKPPAPGQASPQTRRKAEHDYEAGQGERRTNASSPRQRSARLKALKREPTSSASSRALSHQAKTASRRRRTRAKRGRKSA